jgi:hypothetical protein
MQVFDFFLQFGPLRFDGPMTKLEFMRALTHGLFGLPFGFRQNGTTWRSTRRIDASRDDC